LSRGNSIFSPCLSIRNSTCKMAASYKNQNNSTVNTRYKQRVLKHLYRLSFFFISS